MWRVIPKLISLALLWGVVGGIVIYVDPGTVRDVGIEGMYLPMLLSVLPAVWYSFTLLTRSGWVGLMSALLVDLALVLLIIKVFNALTGIAIVGSIACMSYFAINKDRLSR